MLRDALAQFDELAEQTDDLLGAWARGDDRRLGELIREQTGTSPEAQQFMRKLLDDRNVNMASGIAKISAKLWQLFRFGWFSPFSRTPKHHHRITPTRLFRPTYLFQRYLSQLTFAH
ncbi:MAG: hypothetical protein CM15mP120_11550 [Pseudomonadota bacterium]|nr:MAG: hypothetical protein CM15mP120_11550 [Pseudomonadota bacterium]